MKRKWIAIVAIAAIISVSGVAWGMTKEHVQENQKQNTLIPNQILSEEKKEEIETISPKEELQTISFLGEVLSNKTVNVYSRRSGIVEDIYVDIGDKVYKGQTIAKLLSVGVEGESNALIYEKQVEVETAKRNLEVIEVTANTEVEQAQQKIDSAKVDIQTTSQKVEAEAKSVEAKFNKVVDDIEAAKILIANIRRSFANTLEGETVKLLSYQNQLLVSLQSITRVVSTVFSPNSNLGAGNLSYSDLEESPFALFGDAYKTSVIDSYALLNAELLLLEGSSGEILEKNKVNKIVLAANRVLSASRNLINATPAGMVDSEIIDHHISALDSAKEKMVVNQGKVEESRSNKNTILANQGKEIAVIQRQIDVNLAELNRLEKELLLVQSSADKSIQDSKERFKNLMAEKNNIAAKEKSKIIAAQNQVDIKSSNLNSTYVSKGDNKIVSPFTGIVSERFVMVGESVASSNSVVVLDDVDTYLAKKNPLEISFGIPEQYREVIQVGDEVEYWLADQEDKKYKGVISKKGTAVNPTTRNISARASVPEGVDLANKASVRVSFSLMTASTLPSSALRKDGDGDFVWLLDSVLKKHYVDVILKDGEMAYVKNSFNEEVKIILNPLEGWSDGMKINNLKTQ